MEHQGRWRTRIGQCLLAILGLAAPGCLTFMHPIGPGTAEALLPAEALPAECKRHVYVFLVNGLDPVNCANLTGLRDHIQELGFTKTYYGQLYHTFYFDQEIERLHREDPEARFVLIGFSFGANIVCGLANSAKDQGIPIDLIVYLGGNTLKNTEYYRPSNVGHIVNVLASGTIWNGTDIDGAEEVRVPDVHHFGSPCHPATLAVLERALPEVAARVPIVVHTTSAKFTPEPEPTPRPIAAPPEKARDEWDFLKPAGHLTSPSIAQTARLTATASGPHGSP